MPSPYPKTISEYNQRVRMVAEEIVKLVIAVKQPGSEVVIPQDKFPGLDSEHLVAAVRILNTSLPIPAEAVGAPRQYTWDARGGELDGKSTFMIFIPPTAP